ncbi:hypothetical protein [Neptuniibacter caesariensis]|uniref:Uncharacterized protein n=1 Tax=Neptuniibacter caesariensis TaxID=207954 RepID=A0A7U8C9H9_NEPCE|nr:hypothetical protein [Neptuniibacter caesariensis]EAR62346.1 hypothetical protein MED92_14953 [Oceanospirillum sp. MED92] [Neptuniibacter caesariensis]
MRNKVDLFSQQLRSLVTDQNIEQWAKATDKQQFCQSLLPENRFNDLEKSVLCATLSSLLEKKAEDRFTVYNVGDQVLIRKNGIKHPAKVVEKLCDNSLVVLPHNEECHSQALTFRRSKDPFFSRMEGKEFSRICPTPLLRNKALLIK